MTECLCNLLVIFTLGYTGKYENSMINAVPVMFLYFQFSNQSDVIFLDSGTQSYVNDNKVNLFQV